VVGKKKETPISITIQGDIAETVRKVQSNINKTTGIKISLQQTINYIIKNINKELMFVEKS